MKARKIPIKKFHFNSTIVFVVVVAFLARNAGRQTSSFVDGLSCNSHCEKVGKKVLRITIGKDNGTNYSLRIQIYTFVFLPCL